MALVVLEMHGEGGGHMDIVYVGNSGGTRFVCALAELFWLGLERGFAAKGDYDRGRMFVFCICFLCWAKKEAFIN